MKKLNLLLLSGLFAATSFAASAQVLITDVGTTTSSQMPGSPTDFTFFGGSYAVNNFPDFANDSNPGTTVLNDFVATPGGDASGVFSVASDQPGGYATISAPAGYVSTSAAPSPVQTAVLFHNGPGVAAPNLVTFQTPGAFDYSDFYVYVMFGNYGVANQDASIDLAVMDPSDASQNFTLVQTVIDNSASTSVAKFEEFHVTGATAFDTLQIGATPVAGANAVIGGVSFSQTAAAPEPSTWALLVGGLGLLLGIQRFRKIA